MATTPNAAKAAVVTEVKQMLSGVDAALITEYRGLSVGSLATLRRALRPLGAEYKVYKNTLVKIAARDGDMAAVDSMVGGPVAIAFVNGEVSAVAKALRDFAKENTALKLMGAVVDGKAVDAKGVKALADLPSRDVMLAKFAGLLKAPMSNTAYLLSALPRKAAYGLKALVEQKQAA